jgi:hypothetical protein
MLGTILPQGLYGLRQKSEDKLILNENYLMRSTLRKLKRISYLSLFVGFFSLVFSLAPILSAAATDENALWSIDFRDISLSDALRQLSSKTGVAINADRDLEEEVITGSYRDKTIDQIIKGLFRGLSYSSTWYYKGGGVESIKISLFESGRGKTAYRIPWSISRPVMPPSYVAESSQEVETEEPEKDATEDEAEKDKETEEPDAPESRKDSDASGDGEDSETKSEEDSPKEEGNSSAKEKE